MSFIVRPCTYFSSPGIHNTEAVAQVVVERLAGGDIRTVVIASTTGYTAQLFADALAEQQNVTLVSVAETPLIKEWGAEWPSLAPETKEKLERQGVIVADRVPYLLHSSVLDYSKWQAPSAEEVLRETLYAFGQGLKVAVEVVLIAVASGFIEPYEEVIAVGGSARGADTAIVVRSTFPNHALSENAEKRLLVREVLCKPR